MTAPALAPAGKTYSIIASGNPDAPWRLMLADSHGGDFASCNQALARAAEALRSTPKYARYLIASIDTETTGVEEYDQVWEIGAVLRDPALGPAGDLRFHTFVEHDLSLAAALPPSFRDDHDARYDPARALSPAEAGRALMDFIAPDSDENRRTPFLLGACPWFDDRMLKPLLKAASPDSGVDAAWHYRFQCVESYARGWLRGRGIEPPMTVASDDLVAMTGFRVTAEDGSFIYKRHTAMDDALWALAWFDHLSTLDLEQQLF